MEIKNHDNQAVPPIKNREPLPELKLTELHKSDKPIYNKEEVGMGIETIHPWNNYTIITCRGNGEIKIFDENAKILKDFGPPLNQKDISINWSNIDSTEKLGKNVRFICKDGRTPLLPFILLAMVVTPMVTQKILKNFYK